MKINLLTKRVLGFVFGLSLLLGVGMTASSTAQAQYRDPNWQREQIRRQREWEREQRRRQRDSNRDWRNNGRYNDPYNDPYGYGGSAQLRQTALNAGYNEGIKEGRKDRSRDGCGCKDVATDQTKGHDHTSRIKPRDPPNAILPGVECLTSKMEQINGLQQSLEEQPTAYRAATCAIPRSPAPSARRSDKRQCRCRCGWVEARLPC